VIGNFFAALSVVLNLLLQGLLVVILVNALLSWFQPKPDNAAVHLLETVSDFLCNPVRKLFPTVFGGFDLAPMIVMLVLIFLQRWLVPTLAGF
jgi:YggT family protein